MNTLEDYPEHQKPQEKRHFWRSLPGVIALIIIVIIGYYLITEHGAHIASFLGSFPFILLILLCPLMHIFIHKGHGGHKDRHHHDDDNSSENKD